MTLECPHCHHQLSVSLAASGAPEVPAVSSGGTPGPALDLERLITVYCTEHRLTGSWSHLWAPAAESQLRKFAATAPMHRLIHRNCE